MWPTLGACLRCACIRREIDVKSSRAHIVARSFLDGQTNDQACSLATGNVIITLDHIKQVGRLVEDIPYAVMSTSKHKIVELSCNADPKPELSL